METIEEIVNYVFINQLPTHTKVLKVFSPIGRIVPVAYIYNPYGRQDWEKELRVLFISIDHYERGYETWLSASRIIKYNESKEGYINFSDERYHKIVKEIYNSNKLQMLEMLC